jgi:hypothetical protein
MTKLPRWLAAALALGLSGCVQLHSNFILTDASYRPHVRPRPRVYVDHLPDRPYRSVGIIEVAGPATLMDLNDVLAEAQSAGAEQGCELLVDRAIHHVSRAPAPRPAMILVSYPGQPTFGTPTTRPAPAYTPGPTYTPAPTDRHEFICGIYSGPASAPSSEPPPAPIFQPAPPA